MLHNIYMSLFKYFSSQTQGEEALWYIFYPLFYGRLRIQKGIVKNETYCEFKITKFTLFCLKIQSDKILFLVRRVVIYRPFIQIHLIVAQRILSVPSSKFQRELRGDSQKHIILWASEDRDGQIHPFFQPNYCSKEP